MNKFIGILGLCALLTISGCSSVQVRATKQVSKLLHSAQIAGQNGRFDVQQSYINQATKIVDTSIKPQKPIITKKFISKNKQYITVPKAVASIPVVAVDTSEYNTIISQDKVLNKQVIQENKDIKKSEVKTDKVVNDIQYAKEHPPKSFLSKTWTFFKWTLGLGLPLLIIGGVALAIFIPGAAPFVWSAFGFLFKFGRWILGLLFDGLDSFIKFIETKIPK